MALSFQKPPSRPLDKRERSKAKLAAWRQLRRRVLERDGYRCRVCHSRQQVDAHHIRFRSVGGRDCPSNLAAICRICHDAIHGYRLVVSGDANGRLRIEWVR